MGSIMMHLCISSKIKEKYNFNNNFLIGCILPDIYKKVSSNRDETHYIKRFYDHESFIDLPDLNRYISEHKQMPRQTTH